MYFYFIIVYIGFRRGFGIKFNVCFVLLGEDDDIGVCLLIDGIMEVFCILKKCYLLLC